MDDLVAADDLDVGGDSDSEVNSDDEVIMGTRQSVRRTSHEYRGHDPLLVSERLDIEASLSFIDDLVTYGRVLTSLIALLAFQLRLVCTFERMKAVIDPLLVVVSWISCYAKLRLLDIDDALTFVRRPHQFTPPMNRTIQSLTAHRARNLTGHTKEQLRLLFRYWRMANAFEDANYPFTAEEAFIIFLCRTRKSTSFIDMAAESFGGDPRHYTPMVHAMIDHLYETFYHKISGNSMEQWCSPEQVVEFRLAIWSKLVDYEIEDPHSGESHLEEVLPFEEYRPFSFIDDTNDPVARPGDEPMQTTREGEDLIDPQRSFFSTYCRGHGLKSQVVALPNGMMGSVFIASRRHNDNGMLNLSGLNEYLREILQGQEIGQHNELPAAYGDAIFTPRECIMGRENNPMTREEQRLNERESALRVLVEHFFADHDNLYRAFRHGWLLRLFSGGDYIRKWVLVSFFMQNCYYCLNESRSGYFGLRAPALADYIPLDENIPQAPEVDFESQTAYQYGFN